jgi:hypothetical protein
MLYCNLQLNLSKMTSDLSDKHKNLALESFVGVLNRLG